MISAQSSERPWFWDCRGSILGGLMDVEEVVVRDLRYQRSRTREEVVDLEAGPALVLR
jgi:hypothetical protein